MTASSICCVSLAAAGASASPNTDFDIFLTSHYHDATLARISTVKDPERIAQLNAESEDNEKRQKLNSNDMMNFVRRRKQLTHYEPL